MLTESRDISKAVQIWLYNKLTRCRASNGRLSFLALALISGKSNGWICLQAQLAQIMPLGSYLYTSLEFSSF